MMLHGQVMLMARTKDLCRGNPVRLILGFALPVLAGNALQQLYNLVDSLIVGQLLGVTALTAVSASGWLDWAMLSIPMGLAQGFSIHMAQSYGGQRFAELKKTAGQSYLLAGLAVLLLELFSQLMLRPALTWMNTPAETFLLTESYLRIIYAGLPIVMCLNVFSGFLNALGNSKTPMVALIFSTVTNIVLDWLFIGPLGMGTNGGACATVIAQGVSAAVCMIAALRIPELRIGRADLTPDRFILRRLALTGLPIAFQNLIISIGGLILQGVVNGFGFLFMAGYNAASRLQGLVEIAGTALGNAVGTFTGQNFGAGLMSRVRLGLRKSAQLCVCLALAVGAVMIFLGKPLLSLFIRDEAALAGQVLSIAYQFLQVMAAGLPMLYLLFVYRSTLQGLGDTVIPMISGFVELGMRVGAALLLPLIMGVWGVYLAEIAAWIGAGIFLIAGCYWRLRRISRDPVRSLELSAGWLNGRLSRRGD